MENSIKKSDFVLTPYMKSDDLRATYQILNTVVPYIYLVATADYLIDDVIFITLFFIDA
jgi:hypothetical protein